MPRLKKTARMISAPAGITPSHINSEVRSDIEDKEEDHNSSSSSGSYREVVVKPGRGKHFYTLNMMNGGGGSGGGVGGESEGDNSKTPNKKHKTSERSEEEDFPSSHSDQREVMKGSPRRGKQLMPLKSNLGKFHRMGNGGDDDDTSGSDSSDEMEWDSSKTDVVRSSKEGGGGNEGGVGGGGRGGVRGESEGDNSKRPNKKHKTSERSEEEDSPSSHSDQREDMKGSPRRGKQLMPLKSNLGKLHRMGNGGDDDDTSGSDSSDDSGQREAMKGSQVGGKRLPPYPNLGKLHRMGNGGDNTSDDDTSGSSSILSSDNKSDKTEFNIEISNGEDFSVMTSIQVIPLLQLHIYVKFHEGENDRFIPITSACRFNIRQLNAARFTCIKAQDNMLHQLQDQNNLTACGDIVLVITSFRYDDEATEPTETPNYQRMESCIEHNNESRKVHAIPLSTDILRKAIKWVCPGPEEARQEFSTLKEGFTAYLIQLEGLLSSDKTCEELLKFIKDRTWHDCDDGIPQDGADLNYVRRFLHKNLARATRIVAHMIDGIHRVTAFDCALLGLGTTTTEPGALCSLGKKRIKMITFAPTEMDKKYYDTMRDKSNEIQRALSQNLPHTLREFLHAEMRNLDSICGMGERPIPYLWDCLSVLYDRLAELDVRNENASILESWIDRNCDLYRSWTDKMNAPIENGHQISAENFKLIIEQYIQTWVKHTAEKILQVLGDSKHAVFDGVIPRDEVDVEQANKDRDLFKRTVNRKSNEYTIFPCRPAEMRLNHFLVNKPEGALNAAITSHKGFLSLFRPYRFCRWPHTDVTFMSCQILLWSRTSKTAYHQLTRIFSSFSPQCRQQTGQGNEEDAFRWVTNFFHNVTDSAFYSHNAWKHVSFKFDKSADGCVLQNNPEEAVYLCLLGSAIRECSDFFSIIGLRPKYDRSLCDFPQQCNSNDMNSIDYLSALVISHSVRMHESHPASTESETYKLHRTRLNYLLNKIDPEPNNGRRSPMKKILGHQHGHPRRLVDGEYCEFVGILTNENCGEDGSDLFTASISQHEKNLFKKKDHLKNTLGEVTVVDGSGDEGGTDDDSERDKDEDSGDNDNNGGGSNRGKKGHRRGRRQGGGPRRPRDKKKGKATGCLGDEGVMNNPKDGEVTVVDGRGDEGGTDDDSERDKDKDSGDNDNNGGGSDHRKKGHPRDKKKGKATGRLGDEGVMNNPEDDEEVEEQGGNRSKEIPTESKKLKENDSKQFAMYLRIITSPMLMRFIEDPNNVSNLRAQEVRSLLQEYENHIQTDPKCQVSSCTLAHVSYSRLCEHHLRTFIESNMMEQFGKTPLQMLYGEVTEDERRRQHQVALARTNFDEGELPPERCVYHDGHERRRPRSRFIDYEAADNVGEYDVDWSGMNPRNQNGHDQDSDSDDMHADNHQDNNNNPRNQDGHDQDSDRDHMQSAGVPSLNLDLSVDDNEDDDFWSMLGLGLSEADVPHDGQSIQDGEGNP